MANVVGVAAVVGSAHLAADSVVVDEDLAAAEAAMATDPVRKKWPSEEQPCRTRCVT